MPEITLHLADSLALLPTLPENSVHAVITDPPYGLSEHGDIAPALRAWLDGQPYAHKAAGGFMNCAWDSFVPGPELWREVLRVLKPGGFCAVFTAPRSADLMGIALRLAGFEIHDTLAWLFGQGASHGLHVGKAIDKAAGAQRIAITAPATAEAAAWEGWHTRLKPGREDILLAQKPFPGPVAPNVLAHGTGAMNIDACRIPCVSRDARVKDPTGGRARKEIFSVGSGLAVGTTSNGRFPANVIIECDCGAAGERVPCARCGGTGTLPLPSASAGPLFSSHLGELGVLAVRPCRACAGLGTVPAPHDPDCPCGILDQQSGESRSPDSTIQGRRSSGSVPFFGSDAIRRVQCAGDSGGASRFFYTPKAPQNQRWAFCRVCNAVVAPPDREAHEPHRRHCADCDTHYAPVYAEFAPKEGGTRKPGIMAMSGEESRPFHFADAHARHKTTSNLVFHPTVKPLALMTWLCKLLCRPGGKVLDPFAGTGTTLVAARSEGFNAIGSERDPTYHRIATARLAEESVDIRPPERVQ